MNAFQSKCRAFGKIHSLTADCKGGATLHDILTRLSANLRMEIDIRSQGDLQADCRHFDDESFFARLRAFALYCLPVVVFLDTYEDASHQCIQWVEKSLLPFIATNDNVAAIIAGQITPTCNKLWQEKAFRHAVEPIRLPLEWCRFRDSNRVIGLSDDQIRELVAWADGDPGFLGPVILQGNQDGV